MVAKRHVEVTMACAHGLAADRALYPSQQPVRAGELRATRM